MSRDVVISNSKLNSYGTRVVTEGIDFQQYLRNPILLWMHKRGYEDGAPLPIGTVANIRIDGDNLVGTLVFDEADEFAQKIADKWDKGVLKMVSAGLIIIAIDESENLLLPGQTRATITKSKLQEVSVVDIGANDDALALYNDKLIALSHSEQDLKFLDINQTANNMKKIAEKLSLAADASEADILSAIDKLNQKVQKTATLEMQLAAQTKDAIVTIVDGAAKEGKIPQGKKEHFIALGDKIGLTSLKETFDALTVAQRPSSVINLAKPAGGAEYKKLSDVSEDELIELRESNPEQYASLYRAEYGVELPTLKKQ